jgi:hypothetical protein
VTVRARLLLATCAAVMAAGGLAGCSGSSLPAPTDPGVCWHLVRVEGEYRFNRLADAQPQLEHCAARLEDMRLRFMQLGSQQTQVVGAYQGQFIFLEREGVFIAQKLDATPYLALVRTGDGRLVVPGAIRTN